MRNLKSFIPLLVVSVLLLTMSSFGVLTAVIHPSETGRAIATVDQRDHSNLAILDVPVRIPEAPAPQFNPAPGLSMEAFMSMTPATYKQMTGKKLGWYKSMQLKMAQKQMKKQSAKGGDLPKWAYVVLSIFGLGWLAIGILGDWKGNDWWIALLLYFVFFLPGVIYSLVVMNKYYE